MLNNKVAVITGSGQGVGRAIALAMAKEGASIVTNNRRQGTKGGDAQTTAKEIIKMGGKAVSFFGDISDFEVARKLVETAVRNFGHVDILVNNAGVIGTRSMIWEMKEKDWDNCVNISLKGSFNCTRHASPIMKERQWGRIVNTYSIGALGARETSHYCAAKAGILGLTKAVALELGEYGVTCNCYIPTTRTRLSSGEERDAHYRRMYDAGVLTEEEYLEQTTQSDPERAAAPLVTYLCTDKAASINGRIFRVKWGIISLYSDPTEMKSISKDEGAWTLEELIEVAPKLLEK